MAHAHSPEEIQKEYMKVFSSLGALTALTVIAAGIHFPESWGTAGTLVHMIIGLIIAAIKATMVVYVFMHVKFDNPMLRLTIYIPLFLMAVLLFAMNFLEFNYYNYDQQPVPAVGHAAGHGESSHGEKSSDHTSEHK